jgi:hypothetical protein
VALWTDEGTLITAWLARSKAKTKDSLGERIKAMVRAVGIGDVKEIAIERPQIYRFSPGDPNDLLNLGMVAGGILTSFPPNTAVSLYHPKTWKGNVKKDKHQPLILRTLTEWERTRIETPSAKAKTHNVIDAIGIGLYFFGRLKPGVKNFSHPAP